MNAGKSTILLQSSYNYQEYGMDTVLFTPEFDHRYGANRISSRIGLSAPADTFAHDTNLFNAVKKKLATSKKGVQCVFVDEAHFLTKQQVYQLSDIADKLNIPVIAYGLRTDFRGEPFEGSLYLLTWADKLIEIKTICHCGRKAIMNARIDKHNQMVLTGEQVEIGGNERYVSICRYHFKQRDIKTYRKPSNSL